MTTQKPNPYLSAPLYGLTHFDPGQSDTIPYPVNRGVFHVDLDQMAHAPGGPVNIMNLASTDRATCGQSQRHGRLMWRWPAASESRSAEFGDAGRHGLRTRRRCATSSPNPSLRWSRWKPSPLSILASTPNRIMTSGLYTVADVDDPIYVNAGTDVCAIGLKDASNPAAEQVEKRSQAHLPRRGLLHALRCGYGAAVRLVGMSMTYDGHLIIGSFNGLAVIDRVYKNARRLQHRAGAVDHELVLGR